MKSRKPTLSQDFIAGIPWAGRSTLTGLFVGEHSGSSMGVSYGMCVLLCLVVCLFCFVLFRFVLFCFVCLFVCLFFFGGGCSFVSWLVCWFVGRFGLCVSFYILYLALREAMR